MSLETVFPVGSKVTVSGVGDGTVVRVDADSRVIRFDDFGGLEVAYPTERVNGIQTSADVEPMAVDLPAPEFGVGPNGEHDGRHLTSTAAVTQHPIPSADGQRLPVGPNGSSKSFRILAERSERFDFAQNAPSEKRRRFLKAVDALRFGLVPEEVLSAVTVGIEQLSGWAHSRLPDTGRSGPIVSEVEGPFGTGKSHTMAVIRQEARRRGYLTARVEVDGRGVTFADPAKLLFTLWGTLQGTGLPELYPVVGLYEMAVKAGVAPSSLPTLLPESVRDNYAIVHALCSDRRIESNRSNFDALLSSSPDVTPYEAAKAIYWTDAVAKTGVRPKKLMATTVGARPFSFIGILAAHAYLAMLAGFSGLALTVDEFEVEQNATPANQRKAHDVLAALEMYLTGRIQLPAANLSIFFATVVDGGSVADVTVERMVESADARYELAPWSGPQRRELAERIYDIYCDAYGIDGRFREDLYLSVEDRLSMAGHDGDGLVRAFIKRWIQELDYAFGPSLDRSIA